MNAKDLLYQILDFTVTWQKNPQYYYPNKLKDNKPSYYRLLQIEALLKAFKLSKEYYNPLLTISYSFFGQSEKVDRRTYLNSISNIEYILTAEFLKDREYSKNNPVLIQKILDTTRLKMTHLPEDYFQKPISISWCFNALINYRKDIHPFTSPATGFLEGFEIGRYYASYLESKVSKGLKDMLVEIDDTLALILDPEQKEISLETLKSEFGYPDVDLQEIDLEWRMENY